MAVCQGNERKGEIEFHCDKAKDRYEISIFPTHNDCEKFFEYEEVE